MKTLTMLSVLVIFGNIAVAQELMQPLEEMPMSNRGVVLLKSGEVIEGRIVNSSANQHGITKVTIEDQEEVKHKIPVSEIDEFLIAMNDAVNFQFLNERGSSVKKLLSKDQPTAIPDDFIVYRNTSVNGDKEVLMQLLNPNFSEIFEVYYNPQARKTTSLAGEMITWTGDKHRAFLVSKNGGPLMNVKKDNYKKMFPELFGDCVELEMIKKPEFSDLGAHIYTYMRCGSIQ